MLIEILKRIEANVKRSDSNDPLTLIIQRACSTLMTSEVRPYLSNPLFTPAIALVIVESLVDSRKTEESILLEMLNEASDAITNLYEQD